MLASHIQKGLDKLSVYHHKMEESDAYGIALTGAGGGGATSAKAKIYATRAYDRFIKPGGRAGAAEKEWDIPLAILAVFVPPLAVFFKVGLINIDFVINVCLTILAWFPGVVHAWYVIFIQRGAKRSGAPIESTAYNANARAGQRDKTL
ncbi:UPF0057-domain-containing protein [Schizopora paradoxa]|uniref:UPF0057-domain-containing protein n=1 Tax=Schizopora paradoxa TaxID=27342 RepID=A0A0H2RJK0_9AGAM|nr:UPF0057-domain-containing protein [Schizopora paradoxa]